MRYENNIRLSQVVKSNDTEVDNAVNPQFETKFLSPQESDSILKEKRHCKTFNAIKMLL